MAEDTQAGRILDAKTKGLSLRQIAAQEGVTVHRVRETVKSPVILKEIAQHRTKYAVTSYENACLLTDLIAEAAKSLTPQDLLKDRRLFKDIAWIAKTQFEQSNSILAGLIKDADRTGDQELDEAAKLLAAKVLRKEASLLSHPVEAEGYTDVEFSGTGEAGVTGGEQEVRSDSPGLGG